MHADVTPQPARGGYILREPKGTPDVILITDTADAAPLYRAADILAVQGYTARLVCILDPARFAKEPPAYRQSVLPSGREGLFVRACPTPMETARAALAAIRAQRG